MARREYFVDVQMYLAVFTDERWSCVNNGSCPNSITVCGFIKLHLQSEDQIQMVLMKSR